MDVCCRTWIFVRRDIPAVVIPSLLSLHEKGFGAEAGVATLVVTAAAGVVYGIAGFGVASSLLFVGGGGGGGP